MRLLILIPTYNEAANISKLVDEIFKIVPKTSVLVIDDSSPDGTADIVESLKKKYPQLFLLKRAEKNGLGTAYIEGFKWGFAKDFDMFLEMDADFQHNPEYISQLANLGQKYDVVIGSRYTDGGGVKNFGLLRRILSRLGSIYLDLVLQTNIKDMTGSFNLYRREALEKINLDTITSKGYLFQAEMKYKAQKSGCSIVESPIIFINRREGKSKITTAIMLEALTKVWCIR